MATAETALVARLLATPAVTAIIGNRVHGNVLPQSSVQPPAAAIRYQRISTPRLRDLSGPRRYAEPRIQVDCYASQHAVALALAEAARLALDGYRGMSAQVRITGTNVEDEAGDYEPDVRMHRQRLDVIITHTE